MKIFHSFAEAAQAAEIRQLALGFFDGLHLGHRSVILPADGMQNPQECGLLTFQSHPFSVVNPAQHPPLITGNLHKLKILEQWKLGGILMLPFGLKQSQQSAESFLQDLEKGFPNLKFLSVGEDFRFGHQRKGDRALLKKWADEKKIQLRVTPRLSQDGVNISSSIIREKVLAGNLDGASKMLGRPYSIYGEVVQGNRLGRLIGFPTANLKTDDECTPPTGVYAGITVLPDGSKYKSAINIGFRPTVILKQSKYSIEAFLLDFDGDLYGQKIEIIILKNLRAEQKFSSVDELKIAIRKDIQTAAGV